MARGPNLAGLIDDDAISAIPEAEIVCEICGSGSIPHLIASCARCNAHEHWYCMRVLTFLAPPIWFCNRCLRKVNRNRARRTT